MGNHMYTSYEILSIRNVNFKAKFNFQYLQLLTYFKTTSSNLPLLTYDNFISFFICIFLRLLTKSSVLINSKNKAVVIGILVTVALE